MKTEDETERIELNRRLIYLQINRQKLNEICRKTDRTKSNLVRWVVQDWVENVSGKS